MGQLMFPPHARGWTRLKVGRFSTVHGVSPARAGMDPRRSLTSMARLIKCFPRTRGDGPYPRERGL